MKIQVEPITREAFLPFGDIIDTQGAPDKVINQGLCGRYHDRARLSFVDGMPGVSLFDAEPRTLPLTLEMVERHPLGSQCFIPMSMSAFLVVVANDVSGKPDIPLAFCTRPGQAINFLVGTWHGVLTPLEAPGLFAVVDRVGEGENLQEHWFNEAMEIVPG